MSTDGLNKDKGAFNEACQSYCFTQWVDQRLRLVGESVTNLMDDYAETDKLIKLAEVLSGRRVPRTTVKKKPPSMKGKGMLQMENITIALEFFEKQENIQFETIDSSLLSQKNVKMVLGLTWTLIHHYSLSMVMWDGAAPCPITGDKRRTMLFRQRLLVWIQSKVPEINVRNFTTDWRDGILLGALVDALGPGLCGDWKTWKKDNALENTRKAMEAAQSSLSINMFLRPEHVVDPKLEENSLMTYLSQFPIAELHPDVRLSTAPIPERVKVYGSGVQPTGVQVGAPARFTVETFSAGEGDLKVVVKNPAGKEEKCDVVKNNDKNKTYSCMFVPTTTGKYQIIITFAGQKIPKSPFAVNVEAAVADASKVVVEGSGIEGSDVVATKRASFIVNCKGAGKGHLDVEIEEPCGRKDAVIAMVEPVPKESDKYKVEYGPLTHGPHKIGVFYGGNEIPKSPFTVNVKPFEPEIPIQKSTASSLSAIYGGPNTVKGSHTVTFRPSSVSSECKIIRYIEGASLPDLKCSVKSQSGITPDCKVTNVGTNLYCCSFVPKEKGAHSIDIKNRGMPVAGCPFEYTVGTEECCRPDKVSVSSIELMETKGNKKCQFDIYTHEAGSGNLTAEVSGPSKGAVDVQERVDGSVGFFFTADQAGEYQCSIKFNGQHIRNSPFTINLGSSRGDFRKNMAVSAHKMMELTSDGSKCVASGSGLTQGVCGQLNTFTVDTTGGGFNMLFVGMMGPGCPVDELIVKFVGNSKYSVSYKVTMKGCYTLVVRWGDQDIPGSPFNAQVK